MSPRKNLSKKDSKAPAGPRTKSEEASSISRVGIIAFVGFVIGIAWPRVFGVTLVPEAPVERSTNSAKEKQAEKTADPQQVDGDVIELTPEDRLGIGPPKITSCVNSEGKKTSKCDSFDVDAIVHDGLIALLGCPAATGVFGRLSLGLSIDFTSGKVGKPSSGRSTNLPKSTTKALLLCAEKEFSTLTLPDVPHEFSEYQVYYSLEFKTPEAAAEQKTSVTPASGIATVQWGTAIVRKEGNSDAKIQTRLMSGARVVVTGRLGAWYRVKYDAKGREGWVIGKALGLE